MNQLYRKTFLLFIMLICLGGIADAYSPPKREFRAVWIATVMNIDWPSAQGLSSDVQKAEVDAILDKQKSLGMNAVILQVRPVSDAIYPSALAPWTRYFSGQQGQAPNPFYDPLDYFIEACHSRGLEFHAWFNPYRVKQNSSEELAPGHILTRHPEWGWEYNNRYYFDPGLPEVRSHLEQVVLEVVDNYDIDAVHFDDYFYPYPIAGKALPDSATFRKNPRQFRTWEIADWRRDNVNLFIESMGRHIKELKPWVKFGVSPFGVWRNQEVDPKGSQTSAGITNYDDIYADVLRWQEQSWLDYLIPQLYWNVGHPAVDFIELCDWWAMNSGSRGMYIGHGVYRLNEIPRIKEWDNPGELPDQIRKVRNTDQLKGSAWFSSHQFNAGLLGFKDSLRTNLYKYPAVIPEMEWIDKGKPQAPFGLKLDRVRKKGRILSWEVDNSEMSELDKARFFVVYSVPQGEDFDVTKSEYIVDITGKMEYPIESRFFLAKRDKRTYYISSLDRLYNESEVSEPIQINQ